MKVVVYHNSCADGFGAAYAVWSKYLDSQFIPAQYGENSFYNVMEQIDNIADSEIFIVDFSFPREDMEFLFNNAGRVVWLDHHKTAFEAFGLEPTRYLSSADPKWKWPQHDVVLDNERSGALIAWNYINPCMKVPMLFEAIDDSDRWQFQRAFTKQVTKALWAHAPWSFEQWAEFVCEKHTLELRDQGALLLQVHNNQVEAAIKGGKRPCWINTPACAKFAPLSSYDETADMFAMLGLAVNCPPNITSDVGHLLAVESGTYGLCWHLGSDYKVKCSLRSNGAYDVSAIAKAFGGGGHRNAAGFVVSIEQLIEWIQP